MTGKKITCNLRPLVLGKKAIIIYYAFDAIETSVRLQKEVYA